MILLFYALMGIDILIELVFNIYGGVVKQGLIVHPAVSRRYAQFLKWEYYRTAARKVIYVGVFFVAF